MQNIQLCFLSYPSYDWLSSIGKILLFQPKPLIAQTKALIGKYKVVNYNDKGGY